MSPIIAKASSGNGEFFQPAPQGVHRAICADVVDLGMVPGIWGEKHKVRLVWQLETVMQDGKPFMIDKRYTLSLDERATLRKDLESWRGKPFSLTEAAGFDLERLIGVACVVMVIHKAGTKGGVFANVTAVLPKQLGPVLKVRDYVRVVLRPGAAMPDPNEPNYMVQRTDRYARPLPEHGGPPQQSGPRPIGPSYAPPPTGYVPPEPPDAFGPDSEPFEPPTAEDIPF